MTTKKGFSGNFQSITPILTGRPPPTDFRVYKEIFGGRAASMRPIGSYPSVGLAGIIRYISMEVFIWLKYIN
jgi:hypothetical protein